MARPGLPRDVECGMLDAVDQPPRQHTHSHYTPDHSGGITDPHTPPRVRGPQVESGDVEL